MFQLIAGPCVIESEEMVLSIAAQMKEMTEELGIPYTFKASFDKANRTSIRGFRGPGIERGLERLMETPGLLDALKKGVQAHHYGNEAEIEKYYALFEEIGVRSEETEGGR